MYFHLYIQLCVIIPSTITQIFHEDICEYNYMYSYMNIKYFHFLLHKGLIKVYTIRDIQQISDIPHSMIVINGITISILVSLLSLFVQLHKIILSESVILS